ncbi:MAG: alpha-ketoglutarate-dependent dioxygenase AlkB [Actinomycetota bacterium]
MSTFPDLVWQPSLLASLVPPSIDESFSQLARIELDESSWVDLAPGWLAGSDELFADLVAKLPWQQRSRHMYDKVVQEPRLTALWRAASGEPLEPPILGEMRAALSRRYGVELDSAGLNLYRDGRDSVAWHGDKIDRVIAEPIVAIISLGHPRPFLLRPNEGGASRKLLLGRGDLLVSGGACQRRWQHAVPKVSTAGPRISVSFRHGLDAKRYG